MRDTRVPLLDELPPGGTLNIVDRVGPSLRNSVLKADFDSLVSKTSMGVSRTPDGNRNILQIDIQLVSITRI